MGSGLSAKDRAGISESADKRTKTSVAFGLFIGFADNLQNTELYHPLRTCCYWNTGISEVIIKSKHFLRLSYEELIASETALTSGKNQSEPFVLYCTSLSYSGAFSFSNPTHHN